LRANSRLFFRWVEAAMIQAFNQPDSRQEKTVGQASIRAARVSKRTAQRNYRSSLRSPGDMREKCRLSQDRCSAVCSSPRRAFGLTRHGGVATVGAVPTGACRSRAFAARVGDVGRREVLAEYGDIGSKTGKRRCRLPDGFWRTMARGGGRMMGINGENMSWNRIVGNDDVV